MREITDWDIPIYVKWAHREGDTFVVRDTIPLTVRGVQWRAWTYKEHLTPGTWRVAVFTEEGPVCLNDQCEFTVQVGEQAERAADTGASQTDQTEGERIVGILCTDSITVLDLLPLAFGVIVDVGHEGC